MKIGILAEEKIPADKRVALNPKQCRILLETYPSIDIFVMSSENRCYSDDEYTVNGINVVNDLSDCDVLIGVKEVPLKSLIANKTYLFFSHTIKSQPYNRKLLISMIENNITMIDYEALRDEKGRRILGFGRFAGIVGAYNGFLTYGVKSQKYMLKRAHNCEDRDEMECEFDKINLTNEKIIITGKGRVGNGILEIMNKLNIREVSKSEFLSDIFDEAVFVHLDTLDYNVRVDGLVLNKSDFYDNPELYKSLFSEFANKADIFIAGHYYSSGSPYLLTEEDIRNPDFRLKVVADISCDIKGPIASTLRPSTIANPIYGYDKEMAKETDIFDENSIAVMAVDNLPCELPKDSSEFFGMELSEKVLPALIISDKKQIIEHATICKNYDLTTSFEYLRDYIEGN